MMVMRLLILATSVLLLVGSTVAAVPQVVSYQGRLTDDTGAPMDTVIDLTFVLYEDTTGLSKLWSEKHADVSVENGLFSILLGSVEPLPDVFYDGAMRGLTIILPPDEELLPPIPMVSVVYALRSHVADSALAASVGPGSIDSVELANAGIAVEDIAQNGATEGQVLKYTEKEGGGWMPAEDLEGTAGTAGGWTDLGTVVRQQTLTDKVALGSATPLGKLHVEVADANDPALYLKGSARDIGWSTGEHLQIGEWNGTTFDEHFRIDNDGRVGLGTGAPLAHLHIEGEDQAMTSAAIHFDDIVVEDQDALLGLYSNEAGNAASAIGLAEINSVTGDLVDKWGIARLTSGANSKLRITYGTNPHPYDNSTFVTVQTNGNVGIGDTSPDDGKLCVATTLDHAIIGNSYIFTGGDSCVGVMGIAGVGFPGYPVGVVGKAPTGTGILGIGDNDPGGHGVIGRGLIGVKGEADDEIESIGVMGEAGDASYSVGVYGIAEGTLSGGTGVKGEGFNSSGFGLHGVAHSSQGIGVRGEALYSGSTEQGSGGSFTAAGGLGRGVRAECTGANGYGIWTRATGSNGTGIYAQGGTSGQAAIFRGNVQILARDDGAAVLELGEGLDYAEGFDVSNPDKIVPGMVLSIDPQNPGQLALADESYDTKVAGIAAGANGLGSGVRLGANGFDQDVALAGRVYCLADATGGAIQPGDLLTTSDKPGHAMKVTDYTRAQGAILGKAMQSLADGETGMILVLVTLQ